MGQNLVSTHPSAAEWADIDSAIAVMQNRLRPLLVPMTASAKKTAVKMSDGLDAFCRKALEAME